MVTVVDFLDFTLAFYTPENFSCQWGAHLPEFIISHCYAYKHRLQYMYINHTEISCFVSSTAMRCRSNALNPTLKTACWLARFALFLHCALDVPHEHLSQQNKPSPRLGQPRFFRPLFLLQVFLH